MILGKRIGAVLLMGGEGLRLGKEIPKQFLALGGKEIYRHALDTFIASALFDEIILVCHPDWLHSIPEKAIAGGKTRQESSYRGLKAFLQKPEIVLIHDAVRPFVTESLLLKNITMAMEHGAIDTCIPCTDTLVHAQGKTVLSIPNREEYLRGQTPQTFLYEWILKAHEKAIADNITNISDDCRLVLRLGLPVHVLMGDEKNMKITTEFDLQMANHLLSESLNPSV